MFTKLSISVEKVFTTVLACLLTAGCVSSQKFPDTDIVYQTGTPNSPQIGFVNADGSNNVVMKVDSYSAKPVWSVDGKTLYALRWSGAGVSSGYISAWQEGRVIHVCQNWRAIASIGGIILKADSIQAVVDNAGYQLLLIDLDHCREVKRYVDTGQDQSRGVWGVSLSLDGKHILYAEEFDRQSISPQYSIKIMDLDTEGTIEIGEGVNPIWSPDNKFIAYARFDGIYVMASNGSQNRRIVTYDASDGTGNRIISPREPSPRWSSDGRWLVYHKCVQFQLACSIFKTEVATDKEVKIVDDGLYPFWRSR